MELPDDCRWRSVGELGRGGQAQVFAVKDKTEQLRGKYALKTLAPSKPRVAYERFVREVTALKSVAHSTIIKLVDHSQAGDAFQFYVMEFIDNVRTLKQLMEAGDNPFHQNPVKAVQLFIDLMTGIEAYWEKQIVHRDLSPNNILILPNGTIKIIDFGICQIDGSETITLTDESVGTHNYMAPECESGAEGSAGVSADIYSAGKILWTAITNQKAFSRETGAFTAKSMPKVLPDVPQAWHLFHIFERTIRHNRADRFSSPKECLTIARLVQSVIQNGYPPLELSIERCSFCGIGKLESFEGSHSVFGNPNPQGIVSLQCNQCGICVPRNAKLVRENLERRQRLM